MKIISWNVNGIRAREKAGLLNTLKQINADIICLQEVRAKPEQLSSNTRNYLNNNYATWWISAHDRPGYSGVLVATKISDKIDVVSSAFTNESENGREVIIEYDNFILITVYTPNSGRQLEKLEHRLAWEKDLRDFVSKKDKPIIICGDMNVAPEKKDCNVFSKAGTSSKERNAYNKLIELGMVDVYRKLYPNEQGFTWFSNMYDSRAANKGMRIDHFLVSESISNKIKNMTILKDKEISCNSDHCPIILEINI